MDKKLRYRTFIFLALIVAGGVVTLEFSFLLSRPSSEKIFKSAARSLTAKEFQVTVAEYAAIVARQDPRVALDSLAKAIIADPRLARDCHAIVHEIGHVAYKKYQSFPLAMQYQNETCNSGYMHGIIESYLTQVADISAAVNRICAAYATGTFIGWECYHGLGHGFMFSTSNEVPKALMFCHQFKDSFARGSCVNGVFMENFNTNPSTSWHTTKYEDPNDPFYPCTEETDDDKPLCYLYAPTYYLSLGNNYFDALSWCKEAGDSANVNACVAGVGSQAMKDNIMNPRFAEYICDAASENLRDVCISGAVSLYVNHYGSLGPAYHLCPEFMEKNQPACYGAIKKAAPLFSST